VRVIAGVLVLSMCVLSMGCGGGSTPPASTPLTGNWEITLFRHSNPAPLSYSGFWQQSGSAVTGSVVLGDGCSGVGPLNGTLDGTKVNLDINEFGQDVSLTGTRDSSSGMLSGDFSTLAGGCSAFPSTGTWSAVQVKPLSGTFHGTLVSPNGTLNVSGVVIQGPNLGASNTTLTGTISAASFIAPCAYLANATITGVISGTSISWNFYGADGSLVGGMPSTPGGATIAPDGSSLTSDYFFSRISNGCPGDGGMAQLTFP
jgi:hypothetical protein